MALSAPGRKLAAADRQYRPADRDEHRTEIQWRCVPANVGPVAENGQCGIARFRLASVVDSAMLTLAHRVSENVVQRRCDRTQRLCGKCNTTAGCRYAFSGLPLR